jgi:multidrug efflux system membrane fusion protein
MEVRPARWAGLGKRDRWWNPPKRWLLVGGVLLAAGALILLVRAFWPAPVTPGAPGPGKGAGGMPPRTVRVGAVESRPMPVQIAAVGSVEPMRTVAIRARVDGNVTELRVKPGDLVKAGDSLFVLDQRPFRAALEQAKAALARDKAGLENARQDMQRQQQLWDKQLTPQEAYDRATTALDQSAQALANSRAALDNAQLNLEYATVRAPISGRIGKPAVDIGSMVRANDPSVIVTVNQISPIYATFSVPQRYLADIRARFGKEPMEVVVTRGGADKPAATGRLAFVDNTVDPATGTIVLRATFANEKEALWPGESVSVVLTTSTDAAAKVVPPEAVQTGTKGSYVFVVKPDNTAEFRAVTVDRIVSGFAVISQGLDEGEKVVLDGQLNLVNGTRVQIVAAASAAPATPPAANPSLGKAP